MSYGDVTTPGASAPPAGTPGQLDGGYHALDDAVQDALFRLILSLGAEVWVLKDRLSLLEEALSTRGIEVTQLIEDLSLRPDRAELLRPGRDAFLDRFLSGIVPGTSR